MASNEERGPAERRPLARKSGADKRDHRAESSPSEGIKPSRQFPENGEASVSGDCRDRDPRYPRQSSMSTSADAGIGTTTPTPRTAFEMMVAKLGVDSRR